MAEHRACHGCLDGCSRESAVHCISCVAHQAWPCDAKLYEEALSIIARGVWIAPNSVESMVWTAREALRKTGAM